MSTGTYMTFGMPVEQLAKIAVEAVDSGMDTAVFTIEYESVEISQVDGGLSISSPKMKLKVSYRETPHNGQS